MREHRNDLKHFQKMLGRGAFVPLRPQSTQTSPNELEEADSQSRQMEADIAEMKSHNQSIFSEVKPVIEYPPLTDFLDEMSEDDFVPTVKCPFCGKIEDKYAQMDCPHYIGDILDLDGFSLVDGFEILSDIGKILYYHSEDIAEIIEDELNGICYWHNAEFKNYTLIDILSMYPYPAYCYAKAVGEEPVEFVL